MSVSPQIRANFEAAKSTDHTGVGAAYAVLGAVSSFPTQMIFISSSLDTSAWLSIDGSTDMILILASSSVSLNVSGNKQGTGKLAFAAGTQFYIKEGPDGAPSSGDLSLTMIYGR